MFGGPMDLKSMYAQFVEIAAYIWVLVIALLAFGLAILTGLDAVPAKYGYAGVIAAGGVCVGLLVIARAAKWYADRRQAKLDLAAAENDRWEQR